MQPVGPWLLKWPSEWHGNSSCWRATERKRPLRFGPRLPVLDPWLGHWCDPGRSGTSCCEQQDTTLGHTLISDPDSEPTPDAREKPLTLRSERGARKRVPCNRSASLTKAWAFVMANGMGLPLLKVSSSQMCPQEPREMIM